MTLAQLIAYYVNLLILQYAGLPNATASVGLIAQTILCDNVVTDIQNAYNIAPALGDTAIGPQLDVIGKYVGVDRYFGAVNYGDYFAMVTYAEKAGSTLPTSPPAFGFEAYSTFAGDFDYNGTLQYQDIVTSQNALSDANFLVLVQLTILRNNSNFSNDEIDTLLWNTFGALIRPEEGYTSMTMFYFISGSETTIIQAIISKKLLPKPMGVGLGIVTGITGDMFSMVTYGMETSPFGYGMSTYANFASLAGQYLTYSMIQQH